MPISFKHSENESGVKKQTNTTSSLSQSQNAPAKPKRHAHKQSSPQQKYVSSLFRFERTFRKIAIPLCVVGLIGAIACFLTWAAYKIILKINSGASEFAEYEKALHALVFIFAIVALAVAALFLANMIYASIKKAGEAKFYVFMWIIAVTIIAMPILVMLTPAKTAIVRNINSYLAGLMFLTFTLIIAQAPMWNYIRYDDEIGEISNAPVGLNAALLLTLVAPLIACGVTVTQIVDLSDFKQREEIYLQLMSYAEIFILICATVIVSTVFGILEHGTDMLAGKILTLVALLIPIIILAIIFASSVETLSASQSARVTAISVLSYLECPAAIGISVFQFIRTSF